MFELFCLLMVIGFCSGVKAAVLYFVFKGEIGKPNCQYEKDKCRFKLHGAGFQAILHCNVSISLRHQICNAIFP